MQLWHFDRVLAFMKAVEQFGKVAPNGFDINNLFRELMMRLPGWLELEKNKAIIDNLVAEEKKSSEREILKKQIAIYEEFVATLKDKSRLGRSKGAEEMRLDYEARIKDCKDRLGIIYRSNRRSFPGKRKRRSPALNE